MKKLLFIWSELKATFWFIPIIIIIFSILLAMFLLFVDGNIKLSQEGLSRFFFVNSSDSARTILSTISAAMMGVAGTVFSITLVALTLASSQFGPRLIKNFMYVRLNQIVLGAYISTYLYCLLILNAVTDHNDYTYIPSLSIFVAIIATVANIVLLIFFIHRIAISIQADKVISDISDFISIQVITMFPKKMANVKEREESIDLNFALSGYPRRISIKSQKSGYLQYIDHDVLTEIMSKNNSLIELFYRSGGHIVEGVEIGMLYTYENWEKESLKSIYKQFEIGSIKTSQQDLEFSIHQMVEIALRAISPGINDPYTAITCIDNLTATMSFLAEAEFPSKYLFDKEENLRIITDTMEFEGVIDAAFNQIRQFSGGIPAVIIRLMEALITINGFTDDESRKKSILRHAEMVLNIGKKTIKEENDIQDLIKRSQKILK